ncbi:hypothetical protein [Sulfurimonas sp.]|uniref:hypothetical protein n=1 Tax=Sulfurimonas sp. TaxID=2022749 RepID=UPI0025D2DB39|nr:hypothetical protein [Sulfurimonas sp.]
MEKRKIILAMLVLVLGACNLSAQDDVSIMDLKETTYFLLQDVNNMKQKEEKVLGEIKTISSRNISKIEAMQIKIDQQEKELDILRNKEIIPEYQVSKKLENYK